VTADPASGGERLRIVTLAVYASFAANGVLVASWASRIPQIRDDLRLTPSTLGLLIACMGVGTLLALPLAGHLVGWLGPARAVAHGGLGAAVGVAITGLGMLFGSPVVGIGLLMFGFCTAFWNVAQNVEGASVERKSGRAIMPRFHAVFSIGTVVGALAGVAANGLGISVPAHLCTIATGVAVTCIVAGRHFTEADPDDTGQPEPGSVRRAWREPRTIAIGLFAVALAFAQGAGMDWIAVAAADPGGTNAAISSLAYAAFVAGMAVTRWVGPAVLARMGRVAALRASVLLSIIGVLAFALVHQSIGLLVSAFVWGCGIALGYPVAMSAAADTPRMAAPRISVVASLTVVAFLGGPALIGLIAEHTEPSSALLVVAIALLLALPLTSALKPLSTA
jgi:predicted MFS family arabinose efflux permease